MRKDNNKVDEKIKSDEYRVVVPVNSDDSCWTRISESIQPKFLIKEDINTPESIEKIRNAFSFYKNEILPLILDNPKVTQKKEWYHGLYTHTQNVVFRGICYAVSLWEDPIPVVFACACHDLARLNDRYDEEHWKNAVPVTTEIINHERFNLTKEQKRQIIDAVENHTTWTQTTNYVAACLRDADRTRLSRERGYNEKFFNTEQWKKIWSWSREDFTEFQNMCIDIEWKNPDTITPEEFSLMLMNRGDIKYIEEYLSSPEMLLLYDKLSSLLRIQHLSDDERKNFLEHLFWNVRKHCDISACLEVLPDFVNNENYELDMISYLPIREDNKDLMKIILDDKEIQDFVNKKVEGLQNKTIYEEMGTMLRTVNVDNLQYFKDCLSLNVDVSWLPYFNEDTKDILQCYCSWLMDSPFLWRVLDRLHRRWHTLQSVKLIFGENPITPLMSRLLEFKNFDKFNNIWINEYYDLSLEDKKLFLNGFVSALTPHDILYPNQSRWNEDFKDLQGRMKIFRELDWENDIELSRSEANKEIRKKRLEEYHAILRILLNWISNDERVTTTYKWPIDVNYRKEYREKNIIPPLVDDIEQVLDMHIENVKWRKVKVAELDYNTDYWVSTHKFDSISSIEALQITDPKMLLAIGTNWWNRGLKVTKTGYALIVKPKNIECLYVQSEGDIDSWTGSMKNFYNFEHIMLPKMWDHCECISLVPTAIKKELNLSQEEYTKRINALWNVTTLQEVWKKDKELELAIRRVLKNVRMYEWLVTPTVMGIAIWKKELNEVDDDILDYCVRCDIPLVRINYPESKDSEKKGNPISRKYVV